MGLLTIIGLTLDICGVFFIYIFTIEPQIGAVLMDDHSIKHEKFKRKIYKIMSIIGLTFIIVGFSLQILDNYLEMYY